MNKRNHVVNAVILAVGVGVIVDPSIGPGMARAVAELGIPIVIGALFPDLDTAFGTHRKTFHNLPILGLFVAFPIVFGNLHYVWLGVLTHYVLDLLGNRAGMALLYPHPRLFTIPVGVAADSRLADVVTLAVTAVELLAIAYLVGHSADVFVPARWMTGVA